MKHVQPRNVNLYNTCTGFGLSLHALLGSVYTPRHISNGQACAFERLQAAGNVRDAYREPAVVFTAYVMKQQRSMKIHAIRRQTNYG